MVDGFCQSVVTVFPPTGFFFHKTVSPSNLGSQFLMLYVLRDCIGVVFNSPAHVGFYLW